jgi:hypothetical protein
MSSLDGPDDEFAVGGIRACVHSSTGRARTAMAPQPRCRVKASATLANEALVFGATSRMS